ncbi:MAG: ribose 5-phosphate isomerase B [Luteibaculum sp.]
MLIIGNDHAGTELKNALIAWLKENKIPFKNHGTDGEESVDYPDFAKAVCQDLASNSGDLGLLICGSGNGIAMAANKYRDIRAALCWKPELASLAREHNNANVLVLPARFISVSEGINMLDVFLKTEFEGGRHQRRIDKIGC